MGVLLPRSIWIGNRINMVAKLECVKCGTLDDPDLLKRTPHLCRVCAPFNRHLLNTENGWFLVALNVLVAKFDSNYHVHPEMCPILPSVTNNKDYYYVCFSLALQAKTVCQECKDG